MSPADFIVAGLLLLLVWLAVRRIRKNKGGCSCGCEGCMQNCEKRTVK